MGTLKQKTAFGPGTYRGQKYDKDRLQLFVDSSNRAIQAGIPIPLLVDHAPLNADDAATEQYANRKGAGWIKSFFLGDDGALGWEADSVTDEHVKEVNEGRMKFTSPEFREKYKPEKEGINFEGQIIRHVALTPLPSNPEQGAIETIALEENLLTGSFQFAEEERKPLEGEQFASQVPLNNKIPEKVDDPAKVSNPTDLVIPESPPTDEITPENNPDMPPKATDKSKMQAVIAGLKQLGVVLPSDFDIMGDAALDLMLTGLNTAIEAKNKAEMEESKDDEESPPVEESSMPYSEEDYHKALTAHGFNLHRYGIAGGGHTYKKGKITIHVARANGVAKGWSRHGGGVFTHGDDHSSLASHLEGSQHVEMAPQFSEEELAKFEPKVRAALEAGQKALVAERAAREAEATKARQFAEEQRKTVDTAAREKSLGEVKAARIPAGLKTKLVAGYENAQFSEGVEQPVYTASQVARLVAESIPSHLIFAFGEKNTQVVEDERFNEQGGTHVSAERAEAIVGASPVLRNQRTAKPTPMKPISQLVDEENERHPNNVMRD